MFLQVLKEPVLLDGAPLMKDFQLNLDVHQRKFRMKAVFLNRKGTGLPSTPVDLVVYNYSGIKIDRLSLGVTFNGVEQVRNIRFSAKLSFDLIKRHWKLVGSWNDWPVDRMFDSIMEAIPIIGELASKYH